MYPEYVVSCACPPTHRIQAAMSPLDHSSLNCSIFLWLIVFFPGPNLTLDMPYIFIRGGGYREGSQWHISCIFASQEWLQTDRKSSGGETGKMGHAKILAVDDEENFLQLLTRTLRKEGYEVKTAQDGQEAIRWLEREQCDLALIDIRMTPIDSLEVLGEINRRFPQMKAIMITAYPGGPEGTGSAGK